MCDITKNDILNVQEEMLEDISEYLDQYDDIVQDLIDDVDVIEEMVEALTRIVCDNMDVLLWGMT